MPRGLIVSRTRSRWSRTEISSVTQDTSRRDSFGGGRLLERDRSLDPDPVLEGPVPLDRQRRRIPQGGSTLGEPLVELADQSVDLRVERDVGKTRSEEHTSELQSLMRISYAVFCLKKHKQQHTTQTNQPP